jgi:hypothetical protein
MPMVTTSLRLLVASAVECILAKRPGDIFYLNDVAEALRSDLDAATLPLMRADIIEIVIALPGIEAAGVECWRGISEDGGSGNLAGP